MQGRVLCFDVEDLQTFRAWLKEAWNQPFTGMGQGSVGLSLFCFELLQPERQGQERAKRRRACGPHASSGELLVHPTGWGQLALSQERLEMMLIAGQVDRGRHQAPRGDQDVQLLIGAESTLNARQGLWGCQAANQLFSPRLPTRFVG